MVGRKKRHKTPSSVVLGKFLQGLRKNARLTLREVEKLCDGEIANAYLSQIENGYVQFPHPRCLHALSKAYRADYNQIVVMCYGSAGSDGDQKNGSTALFSIDGLDRGEMVALQAYLINYRQASREGKQ